MTRFLSDEQATVALGQALAQNCLPGLNIYLYGDLGAGKTTLVRGMIQTFLPGARVKSPTYTLVEGYELVDSKNNPNNINQIYHFDLYRLGDPEELEYLGGRDYFSGHAVCLVEWPQRGEGWLAEPDLEILLKYQEDGRTVELTPHSKQGAEIVSKLEQLSV